MSDNKKKKGRDLAIGQSTKDPKEVQKIESEKKKTDRSGEKKNKKE